MHLSVPISILVTTGVALGYEFSGDGTYYGGAGAGGSCTQTYVPDGYKTVAMNDPMYDGGMVCGSCLEAVLHIGGESQYFEAIVDNKCPECAFGDLDLGESGDGRWDVEWSFIPCPELDEPIVTTQGSNPFYAKIKVEGFGGVTDMKVNGNQAQGTDDGYWVVSDGSGSLGCGATLDTTFSDGSSTELCADGTLFGGGCSGKASCSGNSEPVRASGLGEIEEEEQESEVTEKKPQESGQESEVAEKKPGESEQKDQEQQKPRESEQASEEQQKPHESEQASEEQQKPHESEQASEEQQKPQESEEESEEGQKKPEVDVSVSESGCSDLHQQCGGKEFKGPTCCLYEAECVFQNDWYSNCVPDAPKGSKCQTKWNQCGGVGWTGLECCKEGLECTFKNDWYSQCL